MRIALIDLVTDPAHPGQKGLSDVTWDHARELKRSGVDPVVIGPYTSKEFPESNVEVVSFQPRTWAYRNLAGYVDTTRRALRAMRANGHFDLVHTVDYTTSTVLSYARQVPPIVLTTPGNIFDRIENDANPFDPMMTAWLKHGARRSARKCGAVIAISEDMRTWWRRTGTPEDRLFTIPLGVDVERFHPRDKAKARERLGIPAGARLVLSVARLSHENGIDMVLSAFEKLRKAHPQEDWRLALVGDGPDSARLRLAAGHLGDIVTFPGWVLLDDLPDWYAAADVAVLGANSGGLHRVLLLALACGAPFVGTRIAGCVDHVKDGQNGYLVHRGDASAMAERIERVVLGGEGPALARAGRTHAERHLAWPRVAQRVIDEAYAKALGRAP